MEIKKEIDETYELVDNVKEKIDSGEWKIK